MDTVLVIAPAAFLSFLLSGVATWYARRRGLFDHPGARHSHSEPTPRGGGAGLVLAFLVSIVLLLAFSQRPLISMHILPTLLSGTLAMAITGWWDDHHDLSARFRFAVQLGVSLFLLWSLRKSGWVDGWFIFAIGVLFTAWMINLFNFMDGSNGMAGCQGVFAFGVLAWLFTRGGDPGAATVALLMLACCVGFLPWNLGKARVFLGDVGSLPLGFMIAALLLYGAESGAFSLPVALMVMALFLADASLTLMVRVLKGERWYNAHRQHLYQRIIAVGWTHGRVLLLYQAVNLALVLPGIVIGVNYPVLAWPLAVALGLALALGWYLSIRKIGVLAVAG
ncbi:MAG: glycosyltransferase family 4 protein [Xanthomonadales bacterium]|nr:glycosyltransferase family 4 protein [Xanthomonadales bacterium]